MFMSILHSVEIYVNRKLPTYKSIMGQDSL